VKKEADIFYINRETFSNEFVNPVSKAVVTFFGILSTP
jgi:hypothetical protein